MGVAVDHRSEASRVLCEQRPPRFLDRLQSHGARDRRKPLQEVFQRIAACEVLDQRLHRHPCPAEYGHPMHRFRIASDRCSHVLIVAQFRVKRLLLQILPHQFPLLHFRLVKLDPVAWSREQREVPVRRYRCVRLTVALGPHLQEETLPYRGGPPSRTAALAAAQPGLSQPVCPAVSGRTFLYASSICIRSENSTVAKRR